MQKVLRRTASRLDSRRLLYKTEIISTFFYLKTDRKLATMAHQAQKVQSVQQDQWTRVSGRDGLSSYAVYSKEIQKPDLDDRSYRMIRLENGLEALLIHDPNTDKAAAAMNVGVGSLSDPDDMPGLAHFCEHLLFMGTKAFPSEIEYKQYINSNGGGTNAYTSTSNTLYYFSVGQKHLAGGLDRFSGFFHSPLFDPSCTMRELNAVDSENKKNLQSDFFRLWQIFRMQAKPDHPWNKFATGNIHTLTEAAKKLAEKQSSDASGSNAKLEGDDGGFVGRETRRRLIEWWEKHYCASIMNLAILGREPLDELTQMALKGFSQIPNRGLQWPTETPPWGPEQQGNILFAKTVMDYDILELAFPVQRQDVLYESKPASFVSHFIGHEGPGSLHSYLKQKGWITHLSSGDQRSARGFGFMKISIKLTKSGLKNYKDVLEAVYSYISLLRASPPEPWSFEEFKALQAIRFRFRQKSPAESYASSIAELLSRPWARDRILSGQTLVWNLEDQLMKKTLEEELAPERGSVTLACKDFSSIELDGPWLKEKWYGTEYMMQRLDSAILDKAIGPNRIKELFLPRPNEFIPNNFSVQKKEVSNPAKRPRLIRKTDKSRLWFKKDDQFWVPRGVVGVYIRSPILIATAKQDIMSRYIEYLLNDALAEYSYDASLAGLHTSCYFNANGTWTIEISGYTDKMATLLQHVLEKARNLVVDDGRFAIYKGEMLQSLENARKDDPYGLASKWIDYALRENARTVEELLAEVSHVTAKDVQRHISEVFSRAQIEMLVLGNFQPESALSLQKMVEDIVSSRNVTEDELVDRRMLLPSGKNFVNNQTVFNPEEKNNAILYTLQIGDATLDPLRGRVLLLAHMINEPAFNVLRTQEQLGYIVITNAWTQPSIISLTVRVQSERPPTYLENRIDAFLDSYGKELKNMTQKEFEMQRTGLVNKLREKLDNLDQEFYKFQYCILERTYDFFLRERNADTVESITLPEMIEFYDTFINPSSPKRTKISIFMNSQVKPAETTIPPVKFSAGAADALLKDLKAAQIPVDEAQYAALSKSEPPLDVAVEFFKQYMSQIPSIPSEKKTQFLEIIKELAKLHPAQSASEPLSQGKLKEGTIIIEDLAAFRKSLEGAKPAKAVMSLEEEGLSSEVAEPKL